MWLQSKDHVRKKIEVQIANAYDKAFSEFGPVPQGSMWFSKSRQEERFKTIADIMCARVKGPTTICDYGCGYGAFHSYLEKRTDLHIKDYLGLDLSGEAISHCNTHLSSHNSKFICSPTPIRKFKCIVASGTFNYSVIQNASEWEAFIMKCLIKLWRKTSQLLVFNLQIDEQNGPYISPAGIYYAQPDVIQNSIEKLLGNCTVINNKRLPKDRTFVIQT